MEVKQPPGAPGETPEERIAFRRQQLQARRKEEAGDEPVPIPGMPQKKKDLDPEAIHSMEQITETHKLVDSIIEQGNDKVSNIRITTDMTESKRNIALDEARAERRRRVEEDLVKSREEFEKISSQWDAAMNGETVEDLHEALVAQKEACDALLAQKDSLIEDFRLTLKEKDEEFVAELRSQTSDVDTMIELMNETTKTAATAFKGQTEKVEEVMVEDRRSLVDAAFSKWKEQAGERASKEDALHEGRLQMMEEHEQELENLRIVNDEKYSAIKLKLESDIANLQQELQKMRATYQLNSEKLEYNLQVLRKRDDENQTTKSQQKRKMLRMQDSINALKARLKKQEKIYNDENNHLTEMYKRTTEQFKDLQRKFEHFQQVERNRYHEVWTMAEEEARALAQQVLEADKIIFEQQLGLKWHGPPEDALHSTVTTEKDDSAERAASEIVLGLMKKSDSVEEEIVQAALKLLSEEASFLVESKLNRLLATLPEGERHLMKLDAIFKALGVKSESDINRLVSYLIIEPSGDGDSDAGVQLIRPEDVSGALRQFADDSAAITHATKTLQVASLASNLDSVVRDTGYWQNLTETQPESHVKTWSALSDALSEYHTILKDRTTALEECDQLRAQNEELTMLLQRYLSSDINRELVVPPVDVVGGGSSGRGPPTMTGATLG